MYIMNNNYNMYLGAGWLKEDEGCYNLLGVKVNFF